VPISILSVIAALFINQVQLRGSNAPPPATGTGAASTDAESVPLAPGGTH
jgi:hypothetical protein